MKPDSLLTPREAGRKIGVSQMTILRWIGRGRIKPSKVTPSGRFWIHPSQLKDLFLCRCKLCGKEFQAKHPQKAMYCCPGHAKRAYQLKHRRYERRGRPRKNAVPRF